MGIQNCYSTGGHSTVKNWLNGHSTGWKLVKWAFRIAIQPVAIRLLKIGWMGIRPVENWSNTHSAGWKLVEWAFRIAIRLVETWSNSHSTGWKLVEWAFDRLKIAGKWVILNQLHITYFSNKNMKIRCKSTLDILYYCMYMLNIHRFH